MNTGWSKANDIHPVSLLDLCTALNAENPSPVYSVATYTDEPNTLGIVRNSEWVDIIQSDDAQRLYKAIRSTLRRRIREFNRMSKNTQALWLDSHNRTYEHIVIRNTYNEQRFICAGAWAGDTYFYYDTNGLAYERYPSVQGEPETFEQLSCGDRWTICDGFERNRVSGELN